MKKTVSPQGRRRFLAASALALGTALGGTSRSALSAGRRARVVVVGGGWGGLSAARHLRAANPELEVVLLDENPAFQSLPLSNKWLVNLIDGRRLTFDYGAAAKAYGYSFVRARVNGIDRERRQVSSSAGNFDYDWLILACGIRYDYAAWFGTDQAAVEYTRRHYPCAFRAGGDLAALRAKLERFEGGDLVMNLPPLPYRCPPAPYERAMMIAWFLKTRRIKGKLIVLDPGPGLLGFPHLFAQRYADQIVYVPHTPVRSVDPFKKIVSGDVDDFSFDDAILMPPQQAGDLVWQAGLIGRKDDGQPTGWADQDPLRLFANGDERVFLVGDLIGKVSPLFGQYTKSGHVAARLGRIAALEIAARSLRGEAPVSLPDSVCYVTTDVDPPESMRVEASYRQRGDGLIMQTVKQQREAQPRGEDEAWAAGMFGDLLGGAAPVS